VTCTWLSAATAEKAMSMRSVAASTVAVYVPAAVSKAGLRPIAAPTVQSVLMAELSYS